MKKTLSLLALTAFLASGLLLVQVAGASRAPRPAEASAIKAAVIKMVKGNFRDAHFTFTRLRVSTIDSHYAAVVVHPLDRHNHLLTDPAEVALKHKASGWAVIDLGTYQVGCTVVPRRVERDLFVSWCRY